ncbi:hypothetical protein DRJ17_01380 [Candidatus Woesearchaeota archaeon]|nr:MAG: hypothetical protein DRJ17_01380 [Candidatus Woesearchaeota archaeon]
MAIFGKSRQQAQPQDIPIDKVIEMRKHGLSNNQIIQNLQRDGYTVQQVYDAMNQAEMMQTIKKPALDSQSTKITSDILPAQAGAAPAAPTMPVPGQMPTMPEQQIQDQKIEEIAEAIIDEKWDELEKGMRRVIDWKEKVDQRVTKIEQQILDITRSLQDLQKAVLERVAEYDKHVKEIGVDLKAMEKVFSQVLPQFTQNVNELSRVTGYVKTKAKKK